MTRVELRQMVRELVLLTTDDINDTVLDIFLDEGYARVARDRAWPWEYVETPVELDMVVGQSSYPLDAAVRYITAVVDTEQDIPMQSIGFAEWSRYQDQTTSTSRPLYFSWTPPNLLIWPPPATVTPLNVYQYSAVAWGETAGPPFDESFHTILVDWAIHRIWEREDDLQRSDQYRGRFEDGLVEMQRFYDGLMIDRPKIYGSGNAPVGTNMPFLNDANLGGA